MGQRLDVGDGAERCVVPGRLRRPAHWAHGTRRDGAVSTTGHGSVKPIGSSCRLRFIRSRSVRSHAARCHQQRGGCSVHTCVSGWQWQSAAEPRRIGGAVTTAL